MNLKAKCFPHLQGRTCQKPGHSCLRKMVSWCSHPAVDYYHWLARGVQTLVAAWGRGHDVTSLKTAAAELRNKVAALSGPAVGNGAGAEGQAPGTVFCTRCKAFMPCPAVVVADAAQMYEEVPPSRVRHGLRSLITWATYGPRLHGSCCVQAHGWVFLPCQTEMAPPARHCLVHMG